jgi:thioredoxin reductase (NADPH)
MSRELKTDVIILDAGPAGYTAAIYAARASRQPILLTGMQPGGQLVTTTDVENYPGFANVIQGPWLVEQMQAQAEHVGTRVVYDHIVSIETDSRPFRLIGDHYLCDALIYATGAQAKWLGIPSEETFRGFGFRLAPPLMASSSATSGLPSSAVATPRSRRRCISQTSPAQSR